MNPFSHLLISLTSFVDWFIYPVVSCHSLKTSFIDSFAHSLIHSLIHSSIRSLIRSSRSFIYVFNEPPTHIATSRPAHPPSSTFIHPPIHCMVNQCIPAVIPSSIPSMYPYMHRRNQPACNQLPTQPIQVRNEPHHRKQTSNQWKHRLDKEQISQPPQPSLLPPPTRPTL